MLEDHSSLLSTFLWSLPTIHSSYQSLNQMLDLRLFSKYLNVLFLRLLRSNNLETQNDEKSKWKLDKTTWNPKFGLSDLENDLLISTILERDPVNFFKKYFFQNQGIKLREKSYCSAFYSDFYKDQS